MTIRGNLKSPVRGYEMEESDHSYLPFPTRKALALFGFTSKYF